MKKVFFIFIFVVVLAVKVFAADISVVATVSSNKVSLGTALSLTITVTGAQGAPEPTLPPVDGLDIRFTGPATRVSVINGAYSAEQSFNYSVIPLKEGKFTIPSVTVDVKGQTFSTTPIELEVLARSSASSDGNSGNDVQKDLESRLRLEVSLPKTQAVLGEALPLVVRLYVNQLSLQELAYPEIVQDGFEIAPFTEPRQSNEVRNGVNWHVVEFTTNLYPSRAGTMTIAPVVVRGNLVFKVDAEKDPRGGIFDDGFFSNFFNSYQKRAISITSRPITLQVLPLPEEGRPANFSGAVGQYDFTMDAAPLKIKAGDPITLKMAITGQGSLKNIKSPEFKSEGFKTYDPQVKDEPGKRFIEQVIVPADVNLKQIPPLSFSYFDAKEQAYRTITRGPFAIDVAPVAASEEFQAVGFSAALAVPETLGRDILFVKENPGVFERKTSFSRQYALFLVVLALYIQAWVALLVLYFHRRRLLLDPSLARQKVAAREALLLIDAAKGALNDNNPKAFYDAVSKALNDYFEKRLNVEPGKIDQGALWGALQSIKVDERLVDLLKDFYVSAEKARFAGMAETKDKMRNHASDAEDIIRAVERRVR